MSRAETVARALLEHPGPVVIVAHVDPDGDALGSVLALARALRTAGREVLTPMSDPPRYLSFLHHPGELTAPLAELPAGALLVVLDGDPGRASGAPIDTDALVNIDHHASNRGDRGHCWIDPSYAAAALMVCEVIDALGVGWSAELAVPALTGIISDTGHFRFANTDRRVLERAAQLIDVGIDYADLSDRLQWRHLDHYRMLSMVLGTLQSHFGGELLLARQSLAMRAALGPTEDDSDDFVQHYRYAEGVRLAAILKEREGGVKVSVRSRGGLSARRICAALGGGGHEVAAGATLTGRTLDEAEGLLLEAVRRELASAPENNERSDGAR